MAEVLDRLQKALTDRYRIERELGAGGMATVYLAEDLRHHRRVALKVLKPEIAATLGAGRFAREIEVAARLQHPNILPLLDSGEAGGFFFYVMPYVEGESLRDRLARGGELPIPDAVRILMEVADALSEAHAHGVVHRDIKPDNVMLRGRHALVTDFGVAKAVTQATGHQVLTSAGVALGTPAYMAPEQATADPHQDHRVDIYALGVLGYELLTGRTPYQATTAVEMLAAHVTAQPEPLEKYRPTVSASLTQIILKCLAKQPADRWQSAEEVVQHLEPLATPSAGTTPTQTRPALAIRSLPRWAPWTAGAGAVAVIGAVAVLIHTSRSPVVTASNMTRVTNAPGVEFQPAVSPDGKEVAYVAGPIGAPHLRIRATADLVGGEARLADTSFRSEWSPSWSHDGELVRFRGCHATGCAWYETGRLGGSARALSLPDGAEFPSWSESGRIAFFVADTIFTTSSGGASRRRLAALPAGDAEPHSLTWSPDGALIAYVVGDPQWLTSGNISPSGIWVVKATGGVPRAVTSGESLNTSPAWLDAHHLLFVSNRDGPTGVYVVEVGAGGAKGAPHPVAGVAEPHSISYSTDAGVLVYAKLQLRQNVRAYDLRRSAPASIRAGVAVTSGDEVIESSDVSPDGRWIAYNGDLRGGNSDIYRQGVPAGERIALTDTPNDEYAPRWSPDGRELAYQALSAAPPSASILVIPADGGSPAVAARTGANTFDVFPVWSRSGLTLAFGVVDGTVVEPWLVARDSVGGAWHEPERLSSIACYPVDWAPDGSGVLCLSVPQQRSTLTLLDRSGRVIWQRDLIATQRLALGSFDFPLPRYSRDGGTIFVVAAHRDGRRGVWAVPVRGGPAHLVVTFDDPAVTTPGGISVGPDRLYLTVSEYESDIWAANLKW